MPFSGFVMVAVYVGSTSEFAIRQNKAKILGNSPFILVNSEILTPRLRCSSPEQAPANPEMNHRFLIVGSKADGHRRLFAVAVTPKPRAITAISANLHTVT